MKNKYNDNNKFVSFILQNWVHIFVKPFYRLSNLIIYSQTFLQHLEKKQF